MEIIKIILLAMIFALWLIIIVLLIKEQRRPKRPKNIRTYAGRCLRGNCPKCRAVVSNCDCVKAGGISYCSCCGTKIKFPECSPEIEGVKSVTIEQYARRRKR